MAKKHNPRELIPRMQFEKELNYVYRKASHVVQIVFLMALHDSEGFGETRLNRVYARAVKFFDEINEKRVDVMEFEEVLSEKCGVNFVDRL